MKLGRRWIGRAVESNPPPGSTVVKKYLQYLLKKKQKADKKKSNLRYLTGKVQYICRLTAGARRVLDDRTRNPPTSQRFC